MDLQLLRSRERNKMKNGHTHTHPYTQITEVFMVQMTSVKKSKVEPLSTD